MHRADTARGRAQLPGVTLTLPPSPHRPNSPSNTPPQPPALSHTPLKIKKRKSYFKSCFDPGERGRRRLSVFIFSSFYWSHQWFPPVCHAPRFFSHIPPACFVCRRALPGFCFLSLTYFPPPMSQPPLFLCVTECISSCISFQVDSVEICHSFRPGDMVFADTHPFPHLSHPVSPTCQKWILFLFFLRSSPASFPSATRAHTTSRLRMSRSASSSQKRQKASRCRHQNTHPDPDPDPDPTPPLPHPYPTPTPPLPHPYPTHNSTPTPP